MSNRITVSYQPFLAKILDKIQQARHQMLKTVSKETVNLYWSIGRMVRDKVERENGGNRLLSSYPRICRLNFQGSGVFPQGTFGT